MERNLGLGNAERLEEILMGLGCQRLELHVPPVHRGFIEPGGCEGT